MSLKLYFSHYSPPCRGISLVLKALKLDAKLEYVDILTKKYLQSELNKVNPQHTVPTLEDNNFVLWDSHAIAGYLATKYSGDPSLYPINSQERAVIHQRLHFDTEQLYPNVYNIIHPLIFKGKTCIPLELNQKVKRSYGILERFLGKSTWLAGKDLTIADLCCASSISTLDHLIPINVGEHPNLHRFLVQCQNLPYYQEANQVGLSLLGNKIQECLIETYVRNLAVKS